MDPLFTADAGGPIERLFGVWQDVMERPRAKLDMNRSSGSGGRCSTPRKSEAGHPWLCSL